MIETIGWFGSVCLALCALPQSIKSIKEGHSKGISFGFIWLWLFGEISMLAYVYLKIGLDLPILSESIFNTLFLVIIMKYLYSPRHS